MGNCAGAEKKQKVSATEINETQREASAYHKGQGGHSLHFTKLKVAELVVKYKEFQELDPANANAGLSKAVLQKVLGDIDEKTIDILFTAFDRDKSGSVDVKELISGLSFLCRGSLEEKFTFLFETFDKDKNGTLDRKEVGLMLEELNLSLKQIHKTSTVTSNTEQAAAGSTDHFQHTSVAVETVFKKADTDGSGALDCAEFTNFMTTDSSAKAICGSIEAACNDIASLTSHT